MERKKGEEYSMLYDFYGTLLTERQREVFDLYHEENFSLSEIADSLGVSRQAVHISLNKARRELEEYEEKLGLVVKHEKYEKVQSEIESKIDAILKDKERMASIGSEEAKLLRRIKKLIKGLDI